MKALVQGTHVIFFLIFWSLVIELSPEGTLGLLFFRKKMSKIKSYQIVIKLTHLLAPTFGHLLM